MAIVDSHRYHEKCQPKHISWCHPMSPSQPSRARHPRPLDAPLSRAASAPSLQRQLLKRLREAVLGGTLPAGSALPGTRALADALGIKQGSMSSWKRDRIPLARALQVEKLTRGHVLQLNFRNNFNTTPGMIARGGTAGEVFMGFNLSRKF